MGVGGGEGRGLGEGFCGDYEHTTPNASIPLAFNVFTASSITFCRRAAMATLAP
jgi:hypothetical protein